MSKSTKLQELKMKIAELSPIDLVENECMKCGKRYCICLNRTRNGGWDELKDRDLNLEDVLMALGIDCDNVEKKFGYRKAIENLIFGWFDKKTNRIESWQLGKPLHEQDEPTINLLHNILC